jgi:hypothetical protein
MPPLLRGTIRAICEILVLMPMPWRAGLVILAAIIILYWLVLRLFPWLIEKPIRFLLFLSEGVASLLLLPEYWTTSWLRRSGRQPLLGTYAFGDMLQGILSLIHTGVTKLANISENQWHLKWHWIVVIAAIPISLWYVRPALSETTVGNFIDRGEAWWYSLEGWGLTGKWEPSAQHARDVRPAATRTVPKPTATPKVRATPLSERTRTPMPKRTRTPTVKPGYEAYIVKSGDSLSKIADKHGTTVEDIIEANKGKYPSLVANPASIEVDWELLIPTKE